MGFMAGKCVANEPDCGRTGKTCCYVTDDPSPTRVCRDKGAECKEVQGGPEQGICVLTAGAAAKP